MSVCIIRADCPVDNIFFYISNFQPQSRMAQRLVSTQSPKSLFARWRRLFALPDQRPMRYRVGHDGRDFCGHCPRGL